MQYFSILIDDPVGTLLRNKGHTFVNHETGPFSRDVRDSQSEKSEIKRVKC